MKEATSDYESQLAAMRIIMEALKPLNPVAQDSVLTWVEGQLGPRKRADTSANSKREPHQPSAKREEVVAKREGTISVVAQKLGVKSARDLLLAAATHLTLYQGKDRFTRSELVACAKDARSWRAEYANQTSINISRMHDAGVLFEKSKDVFSLSEETLTAVEARLAG